MAQALTRSTSRHPQPFRAPPDERASPAMTGVVNGTLYALVFVWLPVVLALTQCAGY